MSVYTRSTFGELLYAQDEKFDIVPGYYIINNDISTGPGEHWTSLIVTSKTAYIYDSFARDSKKINWNTWLKDSQEKK